ncbi:MAG: hypothetical protein AAGA48_22655 [Myxococcota bacterium]
MIRRIARGSLVGIALWFATLGNLPEAQATSFADLSIEQFTDASTWIVEGHVTKVWTELDSDDPSKVWTRASMTVETVHKGPSNPETLVIESLGGTYGDVSTYVPGMAVYSPGEQVFVFLDPVDDGRRLMPVSMFLGKFTIRRAAHAKRKHVLQVHPKHYPGWVFDHRFLVHPPEEQRRYLDDLRAQVTARLEAGWDGQPIPGISMERLAEVNNVPLPVDIPNADPEGL